MNIRYYDSTGNLCDLDFTQDTFWFETRDPDCSFIRAVIIDQVKFIVETGDTQTKISKDYSQAGYCVTTQHLSLRLAEAVEIAEQYVMDDFGTLVPCEQCYVLLETATIHDFDVQTCFPACDVLGIKYEMFAEFSEAEWPIYIYSGSSSQLKLLMWEFFPDHSESEIISRDHELEQMIAMLYTSPDAPRAARLITAHQLRMQFSGMVMEYLAGDVELSELADEMCLYIDLN